MGLFAQLSARRAAFYFVEREGIASDGAWELIASLARWYTPGDPFAPLPDVLPVWQGSYLPFQAAFDRWAMPDVWAVMVGCPDAATRRRVVAHVRKNPPLGMFDLDAASDDLDASLVVTGFVLPDAYIRLAGMRRSLDRTTGLDIISPPTEEEMMALQWTYELPGDDVGGNFDAALLRMLSRSTGRRLTNVRAEDGFDALLDQAFELFHLGAIGAAGAVAGVAFERLMQAALVGADRRWLREREQAGKHPKLNDVIGKVASKRKIDARRLTRYRELRNDLAHRLGDPQAPGEDEDQSIQQKVEEMLRWLARQRVDDNGVACLNGTEEEPALSPEALFEEALADAHAAATRARTTPMQVASDTFEPIGHAWVVVRDSNSDFASWLRQSGKVRHGRAELELFAPDRSFERNLAWAAALAKRLRRAGIRADFAGRPD